MADVKSESKFVKRGRPEVCAVPLLWVRNEKTRCDERKRRIYLDIMQRHVSMLRKKTCLAQHPAPKAVVAAEFAERVFLEAIGTGLKRVGGQTFAQEKAVEE